MKRYFIGAILLIAVLTSGVAMAETIYDFTMKSIDGKDKSLKDYTGKVVLIVNVASQCGFTPQYTGLEKLYEQYGKQGFYVLGFPCNQFGAQEPGSNDEIQKFCTEKYSVTFPMFSKIEVNGDNADTLYKYLKKSAPGVLGMEAIKWNFTKFLVGKDGNIIKRYAPQDKPEDIEADIEAALK